MRRTTELDRSARRERIVASGRDFQVFRGELNGLVERTKEDHTPDFTILWNSIRIEHKGAISLNPPRLMRTVSKDYGDYTIWWSAKDGFEACVNAGSELPNILRDRIFSDIKMIRRFIKDVREVRKHPIVTRYLDEHPELATIIQ